MSLGADSIAGEQSLAELLRDGIFIDGDWVETKDQDPNGDVRLIQLADVGDGYFRNRSSRFLTMAKAKELRCTFLEQGDILVARMPEPLGRACIFPGVGQPAVTAVDVCILRPNPARAKADWLVKAINSPDLREAMQQFVRGTTRQRISRRNLGTLKIWVPGLPQQAKLAQFIGDLESRRKSGASHAAAAGLAIARFRQSALMAACSGRLTVDWRNRNSSSKAVVELLAELRTIKSGRGKTKVGSPNTGDLPALPETWAWASLGEVSEVQVGGTPSRKEPSYWRGGVPWVSSGEVANCRISQTRETISKDGLVDSNAKLYPEGTVLIAMIGEGKTRGQSAILDIEAATNQNVAGVLPNESILNDEYLWRWALAQYEVTRAVGRGGNQPALNGQKVRELVVSLPPIEEQHEIVRRVDRLLSMADNLSQRIDLASRQVNLSSQAILAKAFRDELNDHNKAEATV